MAKWLNLIAGGILGTSARYLLGSFVTRVFGAQFPYGTLSVNLLGCFLIGFLVVLADQKTLGDNGRMLLMIGFCGAFTTFSAFILETSNLVRDGESLRAFLNVLVSVTAGFLVFRMGVLAAESL